MLRLLNGCGSVYELAQSALADGVSLSDAARQKASSDTLDYDPIYRGDSDWRLLPAVDHPEETSRCLISGTGLTHLGQRAGTPVDAFGSGARDDRQHEDVPLGH